MEKDTKWLIDPSHSDLTFIIRHLMIANVKGSFKIFDGSIYTVGDDFLTAQIDLWIDVSSIYTGDAKRDEHLKTREFFDVENHKQISFISNGIEKTIEENSYILWGNLTINGVTNLVKLNAEFGGYVKDPIGGKEKAGFTITGTINRKDWGIQWNVGLDTGGFMLGNDVRISCEIELIKAKKGELKMEIVGSDTKGISSQV